MTRYFPKSLLSALVFLILFAIAHSAHADTLTLKSGQVHTGEMTAEEDERIQIKLKSSGVRLWFSRDQISSHEKSKPQADEKEEKKSSESNDDSSAIDDDVARARKMLEKLREEQLNNPAQHKKNQKKSPAKNNSKKPVQQPVVNTAAPSGQIEEWINILRNGTDIYKRRNACVKLGKNGATEAIPDLIHALDDKESFMRKAANDALIQITEKDFGFRPDDKRNVRMSIIEKWEDWYKEVTKEESRDQLRSWF